MITSIVKANLPLVIKEEAIDLLEIDEKLDIISAALHEKMLPGFEEYGLTIPQFYVTRVVLPEDDPNFKRIRELHTITLQTRIIQAQATVKTAEAQSEALYRTAQEQSRAAIEAARRESELQRQITETEIAKREAERRIIAAQAEAQSQRIAGLTEAEIMQAKGYTQKDVLQAEVQKAYAEGIGNMGSSGTGGGGGIMGDMLGLGIGMAAAGMMAPQFGSIMQGIQNPGQIVQNSAIQNREDQLAFDTWDCSCGQKNLHGNFCINCGAKRPEMKIGWDCSCGQKGIIGNFCPQLRCEKTGDKFWSMGLQLWEKGNYREFLSELWKEER